MSPKSVRNSLETVTVFSGCRKRGSEFKGGSLHDGFGCFDRFGGSGLHLALLLLVLQNSAVSAVVAVSVVTATPLIQPPLFHGPDL